MRNSASSGETAKNAPRKALPCMRSCRSARSVALRAISNPGKVNTRIFLSMICLRAHSGSRSQACSPSSSDSHTRLPPSDMPSSGLVCVNAFGSQHSTTLTWRRSQFTRIALGRGDHEVGGGGALLFRSVLGIGADVDDLLGIAELVDDLVALVEQVVQVADDRAEVLARRDRAPSADRVEAHGDGALGQQRWRFVGLHFVRDGRRRARRTKCLPRRACRPCGRGCQWRIRMRRRCARAGNRATPGRRCRRRAAASARP